MKKIIILFILLINSLGLLAQSISFEYDAAGNRVKRIGNCSSASIDLGDDLAFCSGEERTLDAGVGFVSYKWNGEEGEPTLQVSSTDTYMVKAVAENGCISTGEIDVTVNPTPVINLGPDQTAPADAYIYLEADAGYQSYTWTGNKSCRILCVPMTAITEPTNISLAVRNEFGCVGNDVVQLSRSEIPPQAMSLPTQNVSLLVTETVGTSEPEIKSTELEKDEDIIQTTYNIYPNPTDGKFFIAVSNPDKVTQIMLYNIQGSLVKTFKNIRQFPLEVDLSGQPKGVYLLKVIEQESSRQFRIVHQ